MNNPFYTQQQLKVFAQDLLQAFVGSGFETVEEPYIDYNLYGFRATYIRRYLLHKPTLFDEGILTTLIRVVGLPFGRQSKKMFILSSPRNINNEPIAETLKLRVHFDNNGLPYVVHGETQPDSTANLYINSIGTINTKSQAPHSNDNATFGNQSNRQATPPQNDSPIRCNTSEQFVDDLNKYVKHILENTSPGLIQLPIEMKLEILKKLSVDSIIRMSQVNNEFRSIIFQYGECLWRHLCMRDFNVTVINRTVHRSWMELYRDAYVLHQVEVCRKERALPGLPERPALPPAPYRLQIEWLPEVLELPFYPLHAHPAPAGPGEDPLQLALELVPLRRADSLDSIH